MADARGPRCLCEEADGSVQVTSRLPTLRVARAPGGSDRAPRPRSAPLFQACVCVWGGGAARSAFVNVVPFRFLGLLMFSATSRG